MIYYLENSAKEDIGRTYPQLEFYKKGEDKKFNYFEVDADELCTDLKLPTFELSKKAKLTDCLSQGAIGGEGLFVSEKLKNLLLEFKLPINHITEVNDFHDAKGKSIEGYSWIQFIINNNVLDYSNTVFGRYNILEFQEYVTISDSKDFSLKKLKLIEEEKYLEKIKIKQFHFNELELKKYDLFHLGGAVHYRYFISEALYKALIDNKITGLELGELKNCSNSLK